MNNFVAVSVLLGLSAVAVTAEQCTLKNVPVPGFSTKSISAAQFQALHAAVTPSGAGERWMEIPWEPDLPAARRKAAQSHKPILMWVMDGHPLGCT